MHLSLQHALPLARPSRCHQQVRAALSQRPHAAHAVLSRSRACAGEDAEQPYSAATSMFAMALGAVGAVGIAGLGVWGVLGMASAVAASTGRSLRPTEAEREAASSLRPEQE